MKVGQKLALGFMLIVFLGATSGYFAIQTFHQTRRSSENVVKVDELLLKVAEMDTVMAAIIGTQDLEQLKDLEKRVYRNHQEINSLSSDLQTTENLVN